MLLECQPVQAYPVLASLSLLDYEKVNRDFLREAVYFFCKSLTNAMIDTTNEANAIIK